MNDFYVYLFMRKDFYSPYYVGKGHNGRCYSKDGRTFPPPTDRNRIRKVKENLTEEESFILEKLLIKFYGRVDNGTGVLRNLTDGGEGMSGHIPSKETNEKRSQSLKTYWKGKKRVPWNKGKKVMTEEQKEHLRQLRLGTKDPEHSKRMKGNKFGYAKKGPMSEEEKRKRSETMKKRVKERQRDENGKFIKK
mgnify:CR=1 FL=1